MTPAAARGVTADITSAASPASRGAASVSPAFAERVKAQAYGLGFDLAGITTLGSVETADAFDRWVERGLAGEMDYLPRWADKRHDTRLPFPGVTSAIVVAMNYGGRAPAGPVARYARGDDYHDVMIDKLRELHRWIDAELGHEVHGKAYVDTGPILERDLARRAGLGWFGKNTNLINPKLGSFFFLGALLIDLEFEPNAPFEAERCGTCTRCIEACPTQAIVDAGVLDATKCISYLTIELKGAIPEELRPMIGELIYGCDICQSCCPWNVRFSQELPDASPFAPRDAIAGQDARQLARELLAMDDEQFRVAFRKSPMKRAKLRGLKRNAAVVLGNIGNPADVDLLTQALSDAEPLVREHAAWALGRIATRARQAAHGVRRAVEGDRAAGA